MSDDTPRGIRLYHSDQFSYHLVRLPSFDDKALPVIMVPGDDEGGPRYYWPVAAICEDVLHIQTRRQIQRLRNNGATATHVREFNVMTRQGMRRAVFLAYDGLGVWLQMLNPNRLPMGSDWRDILPRFQQDALRVVNALALGLIPPVAPELAGPPTERLTLQGNHQYTEFVERRVEAIERFVNAGDTSMWNTGGMGEDVYVAERDATGEEEGVLHIPFVIAQAGRYVLHLRYVPWGRPEVTITPVDD